MDSQDEPSSSSPVPDPPEDQASSNESPTSASASPARPVTRMPSPGNVRPGMLQAAGIFMIVDGFANLLWALVLGLSFACTVVFIFCGVIAIYPLVLGIFEIIEGQKLLRHPPVRREVPTWLGVMQLINALSGNGLSLIAGIITLIAANDDGVRHYFDAWWYRPQGPPAHGTGTVFNCHRCGYDLRGSLAAGATTCPECGADLELIERARDSIRGG